MTYGIRSENCERTFVIGASGKVYADSNFTSPLLCPYNGMAECKGFNCAAAGHVSGEKYASLVCRALERKWG